MNYIWKCTTCKTQGKQSMNYSQAFKRFTRHRYAKQSKLLWNCQLEMEGTR